MFRITKDTDWNLYFIHKKFLWMWVKYKVSISKTNTAFSLYLVHQIMKSGHYDFSVGEHADFFYIKDVGRYTEEFYESAEEFFDKNAEYLI